MALSVNLMVKVYFDRAAVLTKFNWKPNAPVSEIAGFVYAVAKEEEVNIW